MRKLIIIAVVLVIVSLFLGYMYNFQKRVLGLICDEVGITKNTFEIDIAEEIKHYTFIYWYGETPHPTKKDRLLIFHRFPQSDIPESQGKNLITIEIGDFIYGNIGIYKPESFSKHNYRINVKLVDEKLVIDWCISNWYETEMMQGTDTVSLINNREEYEDL